ncbi:MAG: bifunctional pyr operon transcriptional regulator/uracil phosphoribosyltransferase PyrR [Candidatus Eremiobacteraeota bacterium]|nr:bifunctional pyr operon transcriptional regulator/uracil phosphoribosyltransferase PyrR [Candidatus Eremiobacteraeota bacterium]
MGVGAGARRPPLSNRGFVRPQPGSTLEALRERTLLTAQQIDRVIARLAHQILEPEDAQSGIVLLGIRRGGETLACRIAEKIRDISGVAPGLGFLNVNLYRDDDVARVLPESEIHEGLTGRVVVIVDDVLYTGRTVRSALDAVTDLGRPRAIRLAVLVDRGLRELPVQGDYVGRTIPTSRQEHIDVILSKQSAETDRVLLRGQPDDAAP